jgi:aminopeptidase N
MEKAGGRDLSRFFDAWVFGVNIPEAKFSYRVEGSRATFRIDQAEVPIEFPVSIRLTYQSGEEQTIIMIAREKITEQTLELSGALKSVKANEDHGTLAEIR